MPIRELSHPHQVIDWLNEWGRLLTEPAELILIGSAGLLWHVHRAGLDTPLLEKSMDVDPITESEAVASLAYDCMIGSDFEREHGWHVNLMPNFALKDFPDGWQTRSVSSTYGHLSVVVPGAVDLLTPKLKRGEPRDLAHQQYAIDNGLIDGPLT